MATLPPGQLRSTRKRMRAVTSCTDCHRRKKKCDRKTPCTNCTLRGTECHYELFPLQSPGQRHTYEYYANSNTTPSTNTQAALQGDSHQNSKVGPVELLGFSGKNPDTSFGILNKALDTVGSISSDTIPLPPEPGRTGSDWYTAYLRELPPVTIINKLVTHFFNIVNWQYNPLDLVTFMEDKARWDALSYADLSTRMEALPVETRYFPALLFQVLALSLLYWELGDQSCECLKYRLDMSLEDVAREYSDAGATLSASLSKDEILRIEIQAKFLRSLFLKTCGKVAESWDSLGETIDCARRLQWHIDVPVLETAQPEQSVHHLWHGETRRKTWLALCGWEAHMSTMLGWPMRVTLADIDTTPPIDTPFMQDHASTIPYARGEFDPPTPLTIQLVGHRIARFLIRISLLKQPASDNQIQDLHEEIMEFNEHLPPYLWSENPDIRFDAQPDCFWLLEARGAVEAAIWFTVLALHRPHIFRSSKNRNQALKAGLCALRAERKGVNDISLRKCRGFSYLFATFDAAVTVAAIYTLYPKESPRSFGEANKEVEMVISQFEGMAPVNPMADTAAKVLKTLYTRLRRVTGRQTPFPSLSSMASTSEDVPPNHWAPFGSGLGMDQSYGVPEGQTQYDIETISPPLPLHDLLYNGLSGSNPDLDVSTDFFEGQGQTLTPELQFRGEFDNDAFWNIMNQMG